MNEAFDGLALCILMALAAYYVYRVLAVSKMPPVEEARDRISAAIAKRFGDEWAEGVTCPWCLGFWCVVVTVSLVDAFTAVPLPGLQVPATAALVGALGWWLD